ncbi:MAG: hypothetical protein A2430_01725 [Candidatus Liptonbacteria bacterium RIFOXYC1_FULL_36_8]|uniref:Phosphoglycerate mutase n=3 Tax=Candidatus Liptoniibacteriota TaxID=1817909 RepID=A0A1G2CM87_9BACT|nr:MAG: hypothetical protein A2390_02055 [Candidatus Liptonbacteria bacterium RIFOXYB1_FULL_36_10]OGZ03548.1 MAG: hypothetical protein A2604_00570 [Candidatus Liptonbacteria bacterium RIFOXYD1_FULL_36_11]OGZ04387.1 MAG: hypothetical protein A2430_01725 [Candidatus Liptonbacteria bacterium RIFOXYC1_FULL_36_8]
MKVYLVRHGETEGMERGIRLGHLDMLSKEGIKQSQTLANRLSKINFDLIYSSPTIRAKDTCKIILSNRDVKRVIKLNELIERKEASCFVGMPTDEVPWDYLKKHRLKRNWHYKDGESFDDIFSRAKKILEIFSKHKDKDHILAMTHGSIIRAVLAVVIFEDELTPRQYYRLTERAEILPASITILEYTQKSFESIPSWKLVTWMDTD